MAGFTVRPSRFAKVTGYTSELDAPETSHLHAILKVKREGYVPRNVRLRERIDPTLFTADVEAQDLERLESDDEVSSVAISRPLDIVE